MHTRAAAESIAQGKAQTSRYTGGHTFGNSSGASQARIDLRQAGSRSLGCQLDVASLARMQRVLSSAAADLQSDAALR